MVPGICVLDRVRASDGDAGGGVPKLKFVGAGKSDGFGGADGRGAGAGLTAGDGPGCRDGCRIGFCSAACGGGDTSTGGAAGAGGNGGVGSGVSSDDGVCNDGGADGVACNAGSGSVGPLLRPLSNTIVTAEGGGSSSGLPSRRIVTSSSKPIAP